MKSIRDELRSATAEAHRRLDSTTERLDLSDRASYGRFLLAQSGPVLALEKALEAAGVSSTVLDWPQRSRRDALRHDLSVLGLQPEITDTPSIRSKPEIIGTLYVLEGSRLGARFLLHRVLENAGRELRSATQFLRHGEGQGLWPSFLKLLETNVAEADLAPCIQGASNAFAVFEKAFRQAFRRDPATA